MFDCDYKPFYKGISASSEIVGSAIFSATCSALSTCIQELLE